MDNFGIDNFKSITDSMVALYEKKNANYGCSFTKLWNDLGPIAGIVPLHNKLDRITNLVKGGKNNFESLEDSLIDLANYAIMNIIEMRRMDANKVQINPNKQVLNEDVDVNGYHTRNNGDGWRTSDTLEIRCDGYKPSRTESNYAGK